uniref:BOD1/SHG1 domain-containing protein n=1 Tax=Plectus sambesii TaxID=2011161 RepID=A0A914XJ37_9BILA
MTARTNAETTASIVDQIKRQGVFDDFRKGCLSELEDNQQYKELIARVESFVNGFLANINPDDPHTNKHRVREQLRSKLTSQDFFHRSINSIIQQLINRPKVDSDLVPQVELATYRHFGLKPPDRLVGTNEVEEAQKAVESQDTHAPHNEDQVDIDEGAELEVQFESVDDMNEQNMEIDSDAEQQDSSSSVHSQSVPDDVGSLPSESKPLEQADNEGDDQKAATSTDDSGKSDAVDQPAGTEQPSQESPSQESPSQESPSQESSAAASSEAQSTEESAVEDEKKEVEPFVDSVIEALQPISPDSSSNSRPDDGGDGGDTVHQDSPSTSLAEYLQPISPESEDKPERAKKRRGRAPKQPKLEEAAAVSAPTVDTPEDTDSGRRKRPTRNRRPTDPDF